MDETTRSARVLWAYEEAEKLYRALDETGTADAIADDMRDLREELATKVGLGRW